MIQVCALLCRFRGYELSNRDVAFRVGIYAPLNILLYSGSRQHLRIVMEKR